MSKQKTAKTDSIATKKSIVAKEKAFTQYALGFGLSIITTLLAYTMVNNHLLSGWTLGYAVVGLALLQVVIQLVFFLHINQESEPRWNLLALDFTLLIVVIVVIGTLWIMQHLSYHSSPQDTEQFIVQDEGYGH